MKEHELLALLTQFILEAQDDDKYGVWTMDANDKNIDKKILGLLDFRNWLHLKDRTEAKS